jgi:hypothetical protein
MHIVLQEILDHLETPEEDRHFFIKQILDSQRHAMCSVSCKILQDTFYIN